MKKIILIGGGGHCKSVIDVIEQEGTYSIAGIIDNQKISGEKILNYEIIGTDSDLFELRQTYTYAFVTIGQIYSHETRSNLFNNLIKIGYELPTIISPRAYVSKYSDIDIGSIVMHHAVINAGSRIGKNCIINTNAIIEHDAIIGSNCHISTASVINGGVVVEENSFVGSNSTTKENSLLKGFNKAGAVLK